MGSLLRSGPLHPVMLSTPDQEIRRAFQDRQDGRYEAYRSFVQALMQQGSINPGLDQRTATDRLYALVSPELYSILCTERG